MSLGSRAYKRLCQLYRIVLRRQSELEQTRRRRKVAGRALAQAQVLEERVVPAISVSLSGTRVDFDADFTNTDNLYLRTTGGGLLEYSTDGASYSTNLGGGTLNINSGVTIESDLDTTIFVNGLAGGSGAISIEAEDATVEVLGNISTNNADVSIEAQFIEVTSASIVTGTSVANRGDIALRTNDNILFEAGNVTLPVVQISNTDSGVTLSNATLTGRDVTITAESDSNHLFDPNSDAAGGIIETGVDFLFSLSEVGGVALSEADADVTLTGTTNIAARNLSVSATALTRAQVKTLGSVVAVAYGKSDPDASVLVGSQVTITTTADASFRTLADSFVEVSAQQSLLGAADSNEVLNITLAMVQSDIESTVEVLNGATLTVGDGLTVEAVTNKDHKVSSAAGAYNEGSVGVAVTISLGDSTTSTILGGTVSVTNEITVDAQTNVAIEQAQSDATVGTGFGSGKVINAKNNAAMHSTLAGWFLTFQNSTPLFDARTGQTKSFGLAGAISYSDHTNEATAKLAPSSDITSTAGSITVHAGVEDSPNISAVSGVDSSLPGHGATNPGNSRKFSISTAINYGQFTNNATAEIGASANVDAYGSVTVQSEATVPYQINWAQLNRLSDVTDKLNSNLGIKDGFFTSWAQSQSKGTQVGLAGAVNLLTVTNRSRASIAENAQVNQDVGLRNAGQDVIVDGRTYVETVNLSGIFGMKFFGTGGKSGIGGAYSQTTFNNEATATIHNGSRVYGDSLAVLAHNKVRDVSIAESGGSATTLAFNGSFSVIGVENTSIAQIDDRAIVTTGTGNVELPRVFQSIFPENALNDGLELLFDPPEQVAKFNPALAVNSSSDVFTVESTSDMTTGQKVTYFPGKGIAIGGLTKAGTYYLIVDNATTFRLAASPGDAAIGTAIDVDPTVATGESHRLVEGESLSLSVSEEQYLLTLDSNEDGEVDDDDEAIVSHTAFTLVTNKNVLVLADDEMQVFNIAGGISKADNVGIGVSGTLTDVERTTLALIGNQTGEADATTGSVTFGGSTAIVAASNNGLAASGSLAAAVTTGGSMAPENPADPALDGVSLSILFGETPAENGAKWGISISGEATINLIDDTAEAFVRDASLGDGAGAASFQLAATNNTELYDVGGSVAFSSATQQSTGIAGSFGYNFFDNTTRAFIDHSTVDLGGGVSIDASQEGSMLTITASGSGATSQQGIAVAGSVAINQTSNETVAGIWGTSNVITAAPITVRSDDETDITSVAGSAQFAGGKFAAGFSVGVNLIDNDTIAKIEYSDIDTTSTVSITAMSETDILAIAASAGVSAQGMAVEGAFSANKVTNETKAFVSGRGAGSKGIEADGGATISAADDSTIESYAGQLALGKSGGFGIAVAYNVLDSDIEAKAEGTTIVSSAGSVAITATSDADIFSISVGGAGGKTFAVAGSGEGNKIQNRVEALVRNSTVTADANVVVLARADNDVEAYAGTFALAGQGLGLGGTVIVNEFRNVTKSHVDQNSVVTAKGNGAATDVPNWADDANATESVQAFHGLAVIASTKNDVDDIAVTAGFSTGFGIGANVIVNISDDSTEAYIDDSTINSATFDGGDVAVRAHYDIEIDTAGGALGGGRAGVGAAVDKTDLSNTTKAYITDTLPADANRTTVFGDDIKVTAIAREDVVVIAVGAGLGAYVGLAGAGTAVDSDSTTEAFIHEADLTASADLTVTANGRIDVTFWTGTVGAAGYAGAGGSVAVGKFSPTTRAYMTGIDADVGGDVGVTATETMDVESRVGTVGAGEIAGIAGAVVVIEFGGVTAAFVGTGVRNSEVDATGNVTVSANDTIVIDDITGAIGLGGTGVGASVEVVSVKRTTDAHIGGGSHVEAGGDVNVTADATRTFDSKIVAFAGGASIGIAGAVSVINIGRGPESQGAGQIAPASGSASGTSAAGAGLPSFSSGADDPLGGGFETAANAVGFVLSVAVDPTVTGTAAYIGPGAHVSAGEDINVTADETVTVDLISGGIGIGLGAASVGASIGIVTLDSKTEAFADEGVILNADDDITVSADLVNDTDVHAIAGAASAAIYSLALGVQVAIINDTSEQAAYFVSADNYDDAVRVEHADEVIIEATADRTVDAFSVSAAVGGLAIGAAVARVDLSGSTTATAGDHSLFGEAPPDADAPVLVHDHGEGEPLPPEGPTVWAPTVRSLRVNAINTSSASTEMWAVAAGIGAGTGNDASIIVNPTVRASIGDEVQAYVSGAVEVCATATPEGEAEGRGITAGAVAVGVVLTDVNVRPTVSATIGAEVIIEAASLLVCAVTAVPESGTSAEADSFAGAGGLIGVNATMADADATSNVSATLGSGGTYHITKQYDGSGVLIAGTGVAEVRATNSTNQDASVAGYQGGVIAVGANFSEATSNNTTTATLGSGLDFEAATLRLIANGNDTNWAEAASGSGGVVSGAAADAKTRTTSTTRAIIEAGAADKKYVVENFEVDADQITDGNGKTDSINASVVGGSGAYVDNESTAVTEVLFRQNVTVEAFNITINAETHYRKNQLSDENAEGASGGLFDFAAVSSTTDIDNRTKVDIANGVSLRVLIGPDRPIPVTSTITGETFRLVRATPGTLEINALNDVFGRDTAKLDNGGAIAIAMSESTLRANRNEAHVIVGDATLTSVGDLNLTARADIDLAANSRAKTYGLSGSAEGESDVVARVDNKIELNNGAYVRADNDINLYAGKNADNQNNDIDLRATTDLYNRTVLPVNTDPEADIEATINDRVLINSGAEVLAVGNANLVAHIGNFDAVEDGHGKDLYREIIAAIANALTFGAADLSLDLTDDGDVALSENNGVTVNGAVEVGVQHKQLLTIDEELDLGNERDIADLTAEINALNLVIDALPENDPQRVALNLQRDGLLEDLTAAEQGLTPNGITILPVANPDHALVGDLTLTVENLGSNLIAQIRRLQDLKVRYAGNAVAVAGFRAQIGQLMAQLDDLGLIADNDPSRTNPALTPSIIAEYKVTYINVPDSLARLGNINVTGSYLVGSGRLESPGDAEIRIVNNSPYNLRINDLTIPVDDGGLIRMNGVSVANTSEIQSHNALGQAANFSTVLTTATSAAPIIDVQENFNVAFALQEEFEDVKPPQIEIVGDLSNLRGVLDIFNNTGSIISKGNLDAATINLNAGRDFVLTDSDFYHIGGSPEGQWIPEQNASETPVINYLRANAPATYSTGRDVAGTKIGGNSVAGNNVFITAQYVNVNGTIQSGRPDRSVTIPANVTNPYYSIFAVIGTFKAQSTVTLQDMATRGRVEYLRQVAAGQNPAKYLDLTPSPNTANPTSIQTKLNLETGQIEVDNVAVEGGYMQLFGQVISTGNGFVKVMDGFGRINVNNPTTVPVMFNKINTGGNGIEGKLVLIDTGKLDVGGNPLTTTYTHVGSDVQITTDQGGSSTLTNTRHATYQPAPAQRYYWVRGQESTRNVTKYWVSRSFWGVDEFAADPGSQPDSISETPSTATPIPLPGGIFGTTGNAGFLGYTYAFQRVTTTGLTFAGQREESHCHGWWKFCTDEDHLWRYYTQGVKDFHTHSVAASYQFDIDFIGYDSGDIAITSGGSVNLKGSITNTSGNVAITSTGGAINRVAENSINAPSISLSAATGIGNVTPVQTDLLGTTGSVSAVTTAGNVQLREIDGTLKFNNITTGSGNVTVTADEDILKLNGTSLIRGGLITLTATNGHIGALGDLVRIDSGLGTLDGLQGQAAEGLFLQETTGSLRLIRLQSGADEAINPIGDIVLEVPNGNLIDANPEERQDTRAIDQLRTMWDEMRLTGSLAQQAADENIAAFERLKTREYQTYWSYRKAQPDGGTVFMNSSLYTITLSDAERAAYRSQLTDDNGDPLSDAAFNVFIATLEANRTADYQRLNTEYNITDPTQGLVADTYNATFAWTATAAERAELSEGAIWTEDELRFGINAGLLKRVADTTTKIEAPNLKARNVTLLIGGGVGVTEGSVTINNPFFGGAGTTLSEADKIALASAERDDLEYFDAAGNIVDDLTEVEAGVIHHVVLSIREDIDVAASGELNVTATTNVFIGSEIDINIDQVTAGDKVRIKGDQGLYDVSTGSAVNVVGADTILEAGSDSIGSESNPLLIDLTTGSKLTARAGENIFITETAGNLNVEEVFAVLDATLKSDTGNISDPANDDATASTLIQKTNIAARSLNLLAPLGTIGGATNFLEVDLLATGELNGTSQGNIFLRETAGDMQVDQIQSTNGNVTLIAPVSILDFGALDTGELATSAGTDVNADVIGRNITLTATLGGVGISGDELEINSAFSAAGKLIVNSARSSHLIELTGNLTIDRLYASESDANIFVTSAGAIINGGTGTIISAHGVIFTAHGNVGTSATPITMTVNFVEGTSDAGGFFLDNIGGLTVGGASPMFGINANGPVTIVAHSPITITEDIMAAGDITQTATDDAAVGDDLLVTNNADITSTGGSIFLQAGDNLQIDPGSVLSSSRTAAGKIIVLCADFGNADPGVGATVLINGSLSGALIDVKGDADNDIFTLGNLGSINTGVTGLMQLNGAGGTNELNFDDSAGTIGRTGTLSGSTLSGFGMGGSGLNYTNFADLDFFFGSGNDTILITNTNATTPTQIYGNGGNDTFNVERTSGTTEIDGGSGNDTFNIGTITNPSLDDIVGPLTLTGGDNDATPTTIFACLDRSNELPTGDSVTFADQADTTTSVTYDFNATTVNRTGLAQPINYADFETITLKAGTAANMINVATTGDSDNVFIDGNASADTVNITTTGASANLRVSTAGAADTINLRTTGLNSFTDLRGGSEDDRIELSSNAGISTNGDLNNINGTVCIDGQAGTANRLIINDFNAASGNSNVVVTDNRITGLAPVDIFYMATGGNFTNGATNDGILINGSNTVADTFHIQSVLTGSTTKINTNAGDDLINVSSDAPTNTGNLDGIAGTLTLDAGSGTANRLTISDVGATTGNTNITVKNNCITGFAPAMIFYSATSGNFTNGATNDGIRLLGSNTIADTFNVQSTLAGSTTKIESNAGNDVTNISSDAPTNTGNLDGILGTLTVDSGTGTTNRLIISDLGATTGNSNIIVTNNSITGFAPATINYSATGGNFTNGLTNDGICLIGSDTVGDLFLISSTLLGNTTKIDSRGGTDTFNVASSSATNFGDLDNIAGKLTLIAGTNAAGQRDLVYLNDRADPAQHNYLINPLPSDNPTFVADSVITDPTAPRTFAGVFYDDSLEDVRLDGTDDVNIFTVRPDLQTKVFVDGNLPPPGECKVGGGDYLRLDTRGTTGRNLKITSVGSGRWTFTSGHQDVCFESIERFNHVDVIAVASASATTGRNVVRVYDAETFEFKFEVMPYGATFRGGIRVATGDLNCDGLPDVVTTPNTTIASTVKIYNGTPNATGAYIGALITSFDAYATTFRGGSNVAIADVNYDGANDLIVAPNAGALPEVRVFDGTKLTTVIVGTPPRALLTGRGFSAFETTYRSGVNIAAGDIDGDGKAEIVAIKAATNAVQVRVFELNGTAFALRKTFTAFPTTYRNGGFVTVGDYNGDGIRDIITGAGPGWLPTINVFAGAAGDNVILSSTTPTTTFLAYPAAYRGGVNVLARPKNGGDVSKVEQVDIFTGYGAANATKNIRRASFTAPNTNHLIDALFMNPDFVGGAFVG